MMGWHGLSGALSVPSYHTHGHACGESVPPSTGAGWCVPRPVLPGRAPYAESAGSCWDGSLLSWMVLSLRLRSQ